MRDIKFRAWDGEAKRMCKVDQIDFVGGFVWIFWNRDNYRCDLSRVEIMQFTGVKDKNGREIYEGDIGVMIERENIGTFNVPDDIIANGGYTGRDDVWTGAVVYNSDVVGFGIDDKKNDFIQLITPEIRGDVTLEIIGNIYENPELLKEGDS